MEMLLQPTQAVMPPRAEPPTKKQDLEVELEMAQERLHFHIRQATVEEDLIKSLKRKLKRA